MALPHKYAITCCKHTKRQRGFSLLELALVISIIGLLLALAVDRLLILSVEAERTSMEQVLGSLRSAMTIDIAAKIAGNNVDKIADSKGINPMTWLSERPKNYVGIKNEADPVDITSGSWYFDQHYGYLIYRVNSVKYFKNSQNAHAVARFLVELDYTDNDDDGEYNPDIDEIHGLRLAAVEPYQWLNEPVTVDDYTHNQ